MTDTEWSPCAICKTNPVVEVGVTKNYVVCDNEHCSQYAIPQPEEDWTELHAPAQVLREISDTVTRAAFVKHINWEYQGPALLLKIKDLIRSAYTQKAQQLSGRE